MLKRLSMIAIVLGIIGFCMGMMPQKVEGAWVTHWIRTYSSDLGYSGKTGIKNTTKDFVAGSADWDTKAKVTMGWIGSGKTDTWAKIFGRESRYRVNIRWYNWSRKFYHRQNWSPL